MPEPITRRRFTLAAAATLAASRLPAQSTPSVASIEHDHILADAAIALKAHPVELIDVSAAVAALTAAFVLTKDESYARAAESHLNRWLPAPISTLATPPTVVSLVPVAELARSTSFLVDAFNLTQLNAWLADLATWLTTARDPVIARDTKDHRASAWLLIVSAIARSQRDEKLLDQCSHILRKPTLRNQIDEIGRFPQEMATPTPLRNTLFNFDLLFGACQLLDSPFDPLWNYELVDGVGLRAVAAYLYPILKDLRTWPGVADTDHFRDVPLRRPALLFAARAFSRPDYADLFRSLPTTVPTALAPTVPIRQPLLWTTRALHGL
jgi:hypothetical protein